MSDRVIAAMAALLTGAMLDALIGDPHSLPHPVRTIGNLIRMLEGLRGIFPHTPAGERTAGVFLVLLTVCITAVSAAGVLILPSILAARLFGPAAGRFIRYAAESISIFYFLAIRSLREESGLVEQALREGSLSDARRAVSMIVGRDTDRLSEEGVAKAAVETVAEGCCDGIAAPLFWYMLLGPVGAWAYKAVNTMDSMVGYRNDRYLHFGFAAAKTDDLANYLPSRLAALLLILSAAILPGYDGRGAYRIWKRDRRNHKSPNSAQTEAACAGALGLRLAGDAWYFGKLVKKPFIGDETRHCEAADIGRAGRLVTAASILMLVIAGVVRSAILAGFS